MKLNEYRVDTAVTVDGRLFHALAAATRNARSPSDDLLVAGTTSAGELDDLRCCLYICHLCAGRQLHVSNLPLPGEHKTPRAEN